MLSKLWNVSNTLYPLLLCQLIIPCHFQPLAPKLQRPRQQVAVSLWLILMNPMSV